MHQEIQIKLDVSISIDARHSKKELGRMIREAARQFLGSRYRKINSLTFAEEATIYSDEGEWVTLVGAPTSGWTAEHNFRGEWKPTTFSDNGAPVFGKKYVDVEAALKKYLARTGRHRECYRIVPTGGAI